MLSIIAIVGAIGNFLVIIVYIKKRDGLTSTVFILALAITDFLCCLTLIPLTVHMELTQWKIKSAFLCKAYYFLNNSFIPFSGLLISSIAFDRYFCLCHPFKKILTIRRSKIVICMLVFISCLIGTASIFLVRMTKPRATDSYNMTEAIQVNNTEMECVELILVNHTKQEEIYYSVVQKFQSVTYILCILTVVILYIRIYHSVSKVSNCIVQYMLSTVYCKYVIH